MFSNWGYPLFPTDPPLLRLAGAGEEATAEPDGICEVVTIPAMDELPYAFELRAGEKLHATITSEKSFDVMLCNDAVYDQWIDRGMPTGLPCPFYFFEAGRSTHTIAFAPTESGHYIVLLLNPLEHPIEAVFNAKTS